MLTCRSSAPFTSFNKVFSCLETRKAIGLFRVALFQNVKVHLKVGIKVAIV